MTYCLPLRAGRSQSFLPAILFRNVTRLSPLGRVLIRHGVCFRKQTFYRFRASVKGPSSRRRHL